MSPYLEFEPMHDWMSIEHIDLPKVCIVTGELVGLFKNGGLGTSMTGIAELLAKCGADVTVIYTGLTGDDTDEWIRRYQEGNIRVEILHKISSPLLGGPLEKIRWTTAWKTYQVLKDRSFDVIHFNDTNGDGTFCFLAKEYGIAFANILLTLAVHSPMQWILESNREVPRFHWSSVCRTGEQISIELADLLWGPSRYLLNWLNEKGYTLPDRVYQQQYVIPGIDLFKGGKEKLSGQRSPVNHQIKIKPKEIVFFGRLEERKGIRLFTAAVSAMHDELHKRGVSVLYMGKQYLIDGMPTEEFVQKRAPDWSCEWRIEDSFGQQEAISYLTQGGRLAVIASPVDNSPCTVYEALIHGIPFIAARTGGIPELIDPQFHDQHLFDYRVKDLKRQILNALDNGIGVPRSSIPVAENQAKWLGFHADWKQYLPAPKSGKPQNETWGVYIDHFGDPVKLVRTLDSVASMFGSGNEKIAISNRNQVNLGSIDTRNVEIVDEVNDKTASEIADWFTQNGATRLLSLRSGIELEAGSRDRLEAALACRADAIVPAILICEGNEIVPSMPGCPSLACLENEFDEGILAVNLNCEIFQSVRRGLSKERLHLGLRDELISVGGKIWPYPEVLARQALAEDVCVVTNGADKRLAAYSSAATSDVFQVLSIQQKNYWKMNYHPAAKVELASDVQKSALKQYLFSNPLVVRLVFGNRLMKKISSVLFRLSHQAG